jgi:outer membrane lipoprotein-sorting protein
MTNTPRFLLSSIAVLLLLSSSAARSARADNTEIEQLVQKADMAYRGKTSAGVLSMKVKTAHYERDYSLVVWGDNRKGHDRALVKILGPALWRGFGTLKEGNQLKFYDPKTNHVTVVSSSMLSDSWMGSHFSNDDLVKETQLAKHYNSKLLDKRQGSSELGGDSTIYKIQLMPKPSAPVAWYRIVYTIAERGDEYIPIEAAYYRKKGHKKPTRTMSFSKLAKIGGKRLPSVIEVTVANKPGEFTRIVYKKLKLGVKIPDSKFTEQALRK